MFALTHAIFLSIVTGWETGHFLTGTRCQAWGDAMLLDKAAIMK